MEFFAGGDVWVLAGKEVQRNDTGLYSCEVNSIPEVRSYHQLKGSLHLIFYIVYKYHYNTK